MSAQMLQGRVKADIKEVGEWMAAMLDELGLDVEFPELRPDITAEDAAAAAARLAYDLRRAEGTRSATDQTRTNTKRRLRAEEQARHQKQLRKDSLGAVYRRLVKAMHTDLQPDPAERESQSRIMQNITAAYAHGDLRTLLQLELELLDPALRGSAPFQAARV